MTMLLVATVLLLGLLLLSVHVAAALVFVALALAMIFSPMPLWFGFGSLAWGTASEFTLFAIPLYILMGELLLRSGISERMYNAIAQWLGRLPGGLMHANIGFAAIFSAMSGSSVACAATLGTIANPMVKRHGYNESLFLGTIASGGALGILLPPSIPLIIYGVLTETSIPRLYLAALLPGILMAVTFSCVVIAACLLRPGLDGRKVETDWHRRFSSLPDLIPPCLIFLIVIGAIYAGWATPTESAALGVVMALLLGAARRRLSLRVILEAGEAAVVTTSMIVLIVVAAFLLNFVLSSIGLSQLVTDLFVNSQLSPTQLIIIIVIFYLILGMFMESLSMLIATVPLIIPAVVAAGIDKIWFGVVMMILLETALLTPPIGINLFVVQGTRESGHVRDVIFGSLPFVVAMLLVVVVLTLAPQIVLWLPQNV